MTHCQQGSNFVSSMDLLALHVYFLTCILNAIDGGGSTVGILRSTSCYDEEMIALS
jgi:hypothetical protein